MKIYLVGGAVRDLLLGLKPKDLDYVVVGATEDEMLKKGLTKVGDSFPVFIHPKTRFEYALARKEIKTGKGHKGFNFDFNKYPSTGVSTAGPTKNLSNTIRSALKHQTSSLNLD